MKNEIKKTVIHIIEILASNDEFSWAKAFEKLCSNIDIDYESSLHSLKGMYGGMGSFNDLVLHKDGIPLINENDELDALRHTLYEQLKIAILSQRNHTD
jgi:hypothetical protein